MADSLPSASGSTLYASAAFQKPIAWALNERDYVRGTDTYQRKSESDLLGLYAQDRYTTPYAAIGWYRDEADGKNPDELGDYTYIEDAPVTTLTGGVYSTLGTMPPRKRPAEFASLASANVITSEVTGSTQAATSGMRARYLTDGKTYTCTGGSWVLDDPQGSPPETLELDLDDTHTWYEKGDLITSELLNACAAVIALMKWTFDSGVLVVGEDTEWDETTPGEYQFAQELRTDVSDDPLGRVSNTWGSYEWPSGDVSPDFVTGAQAAYPVAAGRIATASWYPRPSTGGPFITPLFSFAVGGAAAGVGVGPGDAASSDPEQNEEDFYDSSVTNPADPVEGDTWYVAYYGGAAQLRSPAVEVYAVVWGGEWSGHVPDPRVPESMPLARKTEIWVKGTAVEDYTYYAGMIPLGWSLLDSAVDDKVANLSATFGPCVVPIPTSPLTVAVVSSGAARVEDVLGFMASFAAGLTKWDVEGGFDYV